MNFSRFAPWLLTLSAALTALSAQGQVIAGRELLKLDPQSLVHEINVNQTVATTIMFPENITLMTGFGMVQNAGTDVSMVSTKVSIVHYENTPADTLVVRLLKAGEPCHATIRTARNLYLMRFVPSDTANLAVIVSPPGEVNKSMPATPEGVVKARINFSGEELVGMLGKARNRKALQVYNPGLYAGWEERNGLEMAATNANTGVTATIYEIQRWPAKDALVFRCWITNTGTEPFEFEPNGVKVRVGSRSYPAQLVDCSGTARPNEKTPLDVVLQGNIGGGRENISIHQDFRIELPEAGRTRISAELFGDATADGK